MRIEAVNESSCILYLGDQISDEVADRVRWASDRIRDQISDLIIDLIPSYTSILITYDLARTDFWRLRSRLRSLLKSDQLAAESGESERVIELPVYYGSEVAWDIEDICRQAELSADEVISIHSQQTYRVFAIGFAPGFAYLGQVDSRIRMPRKQTPRTAVPARSLAIADSQTAIYPSSSPGGWQIIGRTPLSMIDLNSDSLARVAVGDRVRFNPVSRDEFLSLGGTLDEL